MIRYCGFVMLLFVMGCAARSPDPQEVLETSRKTTAEAEKIIEKTQKSLDESKAKIDAMKQNPPNSADLL